VLQECLDRVPENADAARELLQYGLKGTDLSVAVLISQGMVHTANQIYQQVFYQPAL